MQTNCDAHIFTTMQHAELAAKVSDMDAISCERDGLFSLADSAFNRASRWWQLASDCEDAIASL